MQSTQNNKTITTTWCNYTSLLYGRYWCIYNYQQQFCDPLSFSLSIFKSRFFTRVVGEREAFVSPKNYSIYLLHLPFIPLKQEKGVDLILTPHRRRRRHFSTFVEYSFWHRLLIRSQPIELQLYIQYNNANVAFAVCYLNHFWYLSYNHYWVTNYLSRIGYLHIISLVDKYQYNKYRFSKNCIVVL